MTQTPIAFVDISFFAHATEDEDKAAQAARNLLPATQAEKVVFSRSSLRGHHGNPITLFEVKVTEKELAKAIAENLAQSLSAVDKETLLNEIGLHVEKGNFYLRFDKQAAFTGSFKLGVADPIRVRLRFKKNKLEDIVQLCKEIGMLP